MARIIYPINGKTYTAEDVEIFNAPRTSGIYSVLDFDCSLSGNVLTIGKGLAWIKNGDFTGKCVAFTEPETLTLDSADSTKNRFDVVAIRYDASKTEPELVIIKGEPADIPFPPERKKETYLYELFLYAILRKAGEGSASFENLSDLRDDETFCGIMRDSVTSSVAPLYETLYDDETGMSLVDGHPIPVETDKYVSYVATVKNSDMIVEIPLYAFDDTSFAKKINGKRVISTSGGSETTFLITFECFPENISISDIFWSSDTGKGQAILTKLVGITKQPEGYVKVDDIYNPESHNAQSGEAVKQAIDEALADFKLPEQDTGSGVSEAQKQTLMAVVNAIGLFNVPNAQELLDNFNKAWDVVEPVPATSITLDKTEITFTAEETQTIVASVLPVNTTDVVAWTSSKNSVATVKNGVVTPLNDGETVITAIAGNVSATCAVTVNMFGEIENAVFVSSGVLHEGSTATSEPTSSSNYPNSVTFSAIPVKSGTMLTCKTNINKPNDWVWPFEFDADGLNRKRLYFTDTTAGTITATRNGFIRVVIMRGEQVQFSTNDVLELSTTTNGEKTTYTLVDRR